MQKEGTILDHWATIGALNKVSKTYFAASFICYELATELPYG